MRKQIRRFFSAVCFGMVLMGCILGLTPLQGDEYKAEWTDLDGYPYQAVWIGTSHIHNGIIPQMLYNEYGLETFSMATSAQTSLHSLSILQDLDYVGADPELVILDVFSFLRPYTDTSKQYNQSLSSTYKENLTDSEKQYMYMFSSANIRHMLESSPRKYLRILGEKELSVPIQYYFPLAYSHSQYLRMDRSNYEPLETRFSRHKNYTLCTNSQVFANPFVQTLPEEKHVSLNEQCKKTFLQIVDFCKSKDYELLLTAFPYCATVEERILLDDLEQLAVQNGINFLSMEAISEGAGIDWNTDFYDKGHSNYRGASKLTRFFGAYLKDTYGLEDRRETPNADSPFLIHPKAYEIGAVLDSFRYQPYSLKDYLEALTILDDSYLLLFTTGTLGGLDIRPEAAEALRRLNIQLPQEIPPEGFVLMQAGTPSTVLAQSFSGSEPLYASVDQTTFRLSAYEGSLSVNHEVVSGSWQDSTLVVYDRAAQCAVESISLNCEVDEPVQRLIP